MIPRHLKIMLGIVVIAIVGVGLYMRQLQKVEARRDRQTALVPITSPGAAPKPVAMLIAYDDDAVLRVQEFSLALPPEPTERARELLRALIAEYKRDPSPHPLPESADIRDIYLVPDASGKSLAVIDVTSGFADGHRSGILIENLTIGSIVGTIHRNLPNVSQVKFLVEGEERLTLAGHADLSILYSPDTVTALAREVR